MEEQGDRESQKLWKNVVAALKRRDHEAATDEKSKIEDRQRDEASQRGDVEWQPKLFRRVNSGPGGSEEGEEGLDWILNAKMYVLFEVFSLCQSYSSLTDVYLVMVRLRNRLLKSYQSHPFFQKAKCRRRKETRR